MEFHDSFLYPASFDKVWEMYRDPEFTESRLALAGISGAEVTIEETGDSLTIRASAVIPSATLPSMAQKFISGDPQVSLVEAWKKNSPTAAAGTTTIVVKGAPVKFAAKSSLQGDDKSTKRAIKGDLHVSVPLLGRRIEKEAIKFVPRITAGELEAATAWLGSH